MTKKHSAPPPINNNEVKEGIYTPADKAQENEQNTPKKVRVKFDLKVDNGIPKLKRTVNALSTEVLKKQIENYLEVNGPTALKIMAEHFPDTKYARLNTAAWEMKRDRILVSESYGVYSIKNNTAAAVKKTSPVINQVAEKTDTGVMKYSNDDTVKEGDEVNILDTNAVTEDDIYPFDESLTDQVGTVIKGDEGSNMVKLRLAKGREVLVYPHWIERV